MAESQQERQRGFLASFNTWHEAAKAKYGYALVVAPATQMVQTGEGPRLETKFPLGLQEITGWKADQGAAVDEGAMHGAPTGGG